MIPQPNDARNSILLTLLLLTATACGGGDGAGDRDRRSGPDPAAIPEPAFPTVTDSLLRVGAGPDWPTHGGNLANQRYSPLEQIDRSNIRQLVPAWTYSTGIQGAFETTPLVVGNTMYLTTARGEVRALNAATGEQLWEFPPPLGAVTLCCGPRNNGPSIYNGTVYVVTPDATLHALNAGTGEPEWQVSLADAAAGYSATMAPLAADGRVFVGVSGRHYGVRGFLAAFDAASGEELWRWHSIPSEEDGGWWGEGTATDPFGTPLNRDLRAERAAGAGTGDAWRIGGGGIPTTPAYDAATERIYVNVEGPAPVLHGGSRPGDNLYTGSIVALDAESGSLEWYAQYLPHDVWGLSGGSPPFLFERGGERYVAFAGRTGWVYVFGADDGRPILRSDNFVPQEALFERARSEADQGTANGARMAPGARGGNPGTGVGYDPDTGIAYVGGAHQPMVYSREAEAYRRGGLWIGGRMRFSPEDEPWGTISAIDLGDGEIVWQKRTPHPGHSAALVTAGGLVFMGQGSGSIDAFDAETGSLLWQFPLGAGVHGGPISYAVAGTQYIAVPAGGSYEFDTRPGDDLVVFALASRRPAVTGSYPDARFPRGGPATAGSGGVRQQPTAPDTASVDSGAALR